MESSEKKLNEGGHPEPAWLASRAYQLGFRRGLALGGLIGLACVVVTVVAFLSTRAESSVLLP